MIPLPLVSSALSGLTCFWLAWQLQGHQIVKLELQHANERITSQRAARATLERTTTQLLLAQNNATNRVASMRRDTDAARAEHTGLQSQSADSLRVAVSSLKACSVTATAFSELLGVCSGRYSSLAEKAQGHVSDITTLSESWPTHP